MRIIEIECLNNGAHRNQTSNAVIPVPSGWAILPDDMETPNFPFGEVIVDNQTPPVVTSWTPLPIPEPEPEPTPELSVWDELDAAYQEGVSSAYDQ